MIAASYAEWAESGENMSGSVGGKAPLTLQDLARALGVSRTTASNAFNRPDQLSADLRERILKKARDVGYPGPNPTARMLRTGRTGAWGLLFGERLPYVLSDPAAIALLQGVAQVCERVEASLLITPAGDRFASATVGGAAVDGFIACCLPEDSPLLTQLQTRSLPLVTVDQTPLPGVPSVNVDEKRAASQAAAHLSALGHTHFAVISMETQADGYAGPLDAERRRFATFSVTRARLAGYEQAWSACGIRGDEMLAFECPSNNEMCAKAAVSWLMRMSPRPTAILAMSDRLAIAAMQGLQKSGFRIPEDVSVVGFDDIRSAAEASPPLTTVRQPLVTKGVLAAELLLDAISLGVNPRKPARRILDAELMVRGSTGGSPIRSAG